MHTLLVSGDTVSLNLNLNANKQLAVVKARYQLSWVKQSLFKIECGHSVEYVLVLASNEVMTLLIRIRILLFTLIQIRILLFNLIRIRLFDPDPYPYHFKRVMYLKQYFLYIVTLFSLSVGPIGPN